MKSRRQLESISDEAWSQFPRQDGVTYRAGIKLNGVEEQFRVTQDFSRSIFVPIAHHLGHHPRGSELISIAKVKMGELA
jgi:hypothetical protein